MAAEDPAEEIVQYLIVNESLPMSLGKIVAQGSHASVLVALREVFRENLRPRESDPTGDSHLYLVDPEGKETPFARWINTSFKKIVLRARQPIMEKLEAQGFLSIRDNGHTEVPPNSLTVIALPPMSRRDAAPYVKRLQVFREYDPKRSLSEITQEYEKLQRAISERVENWTKALLETDTMKAEAITSAHVQNFSPHEDSALRVTLMLSRRGGVLTERVFVIPYQELEMEKEALIATLKEREL